MNNVKIQVNTDLETKERAEELFSSLGMNMTTAINVFLKRALLEQGIPFDVSCKIPNDLTLKAFDEVKDMENNPRKYKSYKDTEELKKVLGL